MGRLSWVVRAGCSNLKGFCMREARGSESVVGDVMMRERCWSDWQKGP